MLGVAGPHIPSSGRKSTPHMLSCPPSGSVTWPRLRDPELRLGREEPRARGPTRVRARPGGRAAEGPELRTGPHRFVTSYLEGGQEEEAKEADGEGRWAPQRRGAALGVPRELGEGLGGTGWW